MKAVAPRQLEYEWQIPDGRFDPTIALTLVLGMIGAVFLAMISM